MRLAGKRKSISDITNLRAYIFRMGRNEALRLIEREKRVREKHSTIRQLPIIEPGPDALEKREDVERLERAMRKLPAKQREVVFLKCVEGFTFAEVAEMSGIPQDTAACRYRYGIEKLRNIMESEQNGN